MIKFFDVVKIQRSGCAKCFSFIYTLPYKLESGIQEYLKDFGNPLYPLKSVKLLRIDMLDGFHIEGKIGTKGIKFVIPKKYETENKEFAMQKKLEFERCLSKWLSNVLDLNIDIGERI